MKNLAKLSVLLAAGLLLTGAARAAVLDQATGATVSISCRNPKLNGGFIGTGVLVHQAGYVLTSTTVVPPESVEIRCDFPSARRVPARLVLADEKLELAILKVDTPAGIQPVALGDSRNVRVGQTVITISDPHRAFARSGQFLTSLGILSGDYTVSRQMAPQPVFVGRMLETTATVAPGSDGAPLLDNYGRLIGIISLNVSEARWLGLAVPIDAILLKVRQAIAADAAEHKLPGPITLAIAPAGEPIFASQQRQDDAFAAAAARVAPAVVAIEVDRKSEPKATQPARQPRRPIRRPAGPYGEFFNRPKTPVTGLVVTDKGHILTSYFNVWGELNSITVVLADGRRLPATLLGHDETKDLAMLKVQADDLSPATLSARPASLGMPVATVGRSPEATSYTMTRGIVSATGRRNDLALQVDAETNYGNAGAPLIDVRGEVVGLVGFVRPDAMWGQNSGIGFATTTQAIAADLPALEAGQVVAKPKRGYLGVVTSGGAIDTVGAVVQQVQEDGPADEAGVQVKDIIVAIDGKSVSDNADLANVILARKPGDEVTLTVIRGEDKKTLTLKAVLIEHPYQ